MHDTAFITAMEFFRLHAPKDAAFRVLDVGGRNVNDRYMNLKTRLTEWFPQIDYVCMDIEAADGVDVVNQPGEGFPLDDESFDFVISTSCFEHDPAFWETFCEMVRVTKPTGKIYVNAPANGKFHRYPGDNWRFYGDAGQALAYWAGRQGWAVQVDESFHVSPLRDQWIDFVCVWSRCDTPATAFVLPERVRSTIGPFQELLKKHGLRPGQMLEREEVQPEPKPRLETIPEDDNEEKEDPSTDH